MKRILAIAIAMAPMGACSTSEPPPEWCVRVCKTAGVSYYFPSAKPGIITKCNDETYNVSTESQASKCEAHGGLKSVSPTVSGAHVICVCRDGMQASR